MASQKRHIYVRMRRHAWQDKSLRLNGLQEVETGSLEQVGVVVNVQVDRGRVVDGGEVRGAVVRAYECPGVCKVQVVHDEVGHMIPMVGHVVDVDAATEVVVGIGGQPPGYPAEATLTFNPGRLAGLCHVVWNLREDDGRLEICIG